jgi:hypothetical protein
MAMARLRRLRRAPSVSLRDRIVDALRKEILTNRLKPGTVLLERECASRFGVETRDRLLRDGWDGLLLRAVALAGHGCRR